jgi:hypothetical protein
MDELEIPNENLSQERILVVDDDISLLDTLKNDLTMLVCYIFFVIFQWVALCYT